MAVSRDNTYGGSDNFDVVLDGFELSDVADVVLEVDQHGIAIHWVRGE